MNEKKPGKAMPPARAAAIRCLGEVLFKARDVQEALDGVLGQGRLDPRDAGLATELCYGFLRLKGRVDFVLGRFLERPGGLPAQVWLMLGLGAYEIQYLDRVPEYASVNWVVEAVRQEFGKKLAGLANAVLRKVADLGEEGTREEWFRSRAGAGEGEGFWSAWYSAPGWLVALWRKEAGDEAARAWLLAGTKAPPLGVRVHMGREGGKELLRALASREDCLATAGAGVALAVGARSDLEGLEREGRLSFQGLASQQALEALGHRDWPGPIWDACAGRGIKACGLLESGQQSVWASDVHAGRMAGFRSELQRLGLSEPPVFLARAERAAPLKRRPGAILLDAPCTGLGVLGRRPDAKWRRTPRDVRKLSDLQFAMLRQACSTLEPGGVLAYLTCTLTKAENQDNVALLLKREPAMDLDRVWSTPVDSPLGEFFHAALFRKR